MLTHLQGNTNPEISMAVHQTARLCNNTMLSHDKSIKRLGWYLYRTNKEGIVYNSDISKGLECYVDVDFSGGSTQSDASDAENVMSRTGMDIMYDNCQIYRRSSLQTKTALSTVKAEYISLKSVLLEVLPLKNITEEIN